MLLQFHRHFIGERKRSLFVKILQADTFLFLVSEHFVFLLCINVLFFLTCKGKCRTNLKALRGPSYESAQIIITLY